MKLNIEGKSLDYRFNFLNLLMYIAFFVFLGAFVYFITIYSGFLNKVFIGFLNILFLLYIFSFFSLVFIRETKFIKYDGNNIFLKKSFLHYYKSYLYDFLSFILLGMPNLKMKFYKGLIISGLKIGESQLKFNDDEKGKKRIFNLYLINVITFVAIIILKLSKLDNYFAFVSIARFCFSVWYYKEFLSYFISNIRIGDCKVVPSFSALQYFLLDISIALKVIFTLGLGQKFVFNSYLKFLGNYAILEKVEEV